MQSLHAHVAQQAHFHTCFDDAQLASSPTHVIRVYCLIMCVDKSSFCLYCFGIHFLFQMRGIKNYPVELSVCVSVLEGGWRVDESCLILSSDLWMKYVSPRDTFRYSVSCSSKERAVVLHNHWAIWRWLRTILYLQGRNRTVF